MYQEYYNNIKNRVLTTFASADETTAAEDLPSTAPPATDGTRRLEAGRQRRGIFDRQRQQQETVGSQRLRAVTQEDTTTREDTTENLVSRTAAFLKALQDDTEDYMSSQQEDEAEFVGAFGADGAEFDAPPSKGLASRRPPRRGEFPSSLIQSESGGDWGALNMEEGAGGVRGHGGRLQFGHARLQDAARAGVIPKGMTAQEFAKQSPEVQMAVEDWHFSDIDNRIERSGLNEYIGTKINGVPVTIDGMRAVAHLGGMNGLNRFIKSGGKHNPADSFGTSLLDYLRMHAGTTKRDD